MQGRLGRGRYSDHSVHPVVERHVLAHLHVPAADKSDVRVDVELADRCRHAFLQAQKNRSTRPADEFCN